MVETHPELFEGATEAISEVGGFSATIDGKRAYLLQTAEKGIAWLKLTAAGRAGHGSQINDANAVTRLAAAVSRIGEHDWPISYTDTTRAFLEGVSSMTGIEFTDDNPEVLLNELGNVARFVGATLQNTSNPTALSAGYKHNVIPGGAEALIDVRTLPGQHEEVIAKLRELAGPDVHLSSVHQDRALEVPFAGNLVDQMVAALGREDPGGRGASLHALRRHRQQVAFAAGHHRLRVRPAAAARGTGFHRNVPRRRRACARRFVEVRDPGPARPADHLLGPTGRGHTEHRHAVRSPAVFD